MSENGGPGTALPLLTKADFSSDQETRWCPGCGDYAILASVQGFMPELGVPPDKIVFVTGIGCAGRFVYYMDTYGMHGIHGRAPALATGVATSRPDLSVWVVSGDGDALSIGGNHLIHALRRNVPLKILLFNNQIYGLTKGQYSPTSEEGKVTKSTPFGSQDHPFNPVSLALGAEATFVARTVDTDKQHLADTLRAAAAHRGTAFVEIYQNCNVFNDGAFDAVRAKGQKELNHPARARQADPLRPGGRARGGARRPRAPRARGQRDGRGGRFARARRAPSRAQPRLRAGPPVGTPDRPDPDRDLPRGRASRVRRGAAARARGRARAGGPGRAARAAALGRHLVGGVAPPGPGLSAAPSAGSGLRRG
jgi:2-oxoglutarate ferredoxin oxidoreductase subunit beta